MAGNIRLLWVVTLMLPVLIPIDVYADIIMVPTGGLFLEGTDIKLTCNVTNNKFVVWEEVSDETAIFIGKEKNTENNKYDNFEISSGKDDFTITIRNSSLSDEGAYICKDREQHANAAVNISVLPQLDISMTQHEEHVSTREVNITCFAYNGKPAISWFEFNINTNQHKNVTGALTIHNELARKTFNSSAMIPYRLEANKTSVVCQVSSAGQVLSLTKTFGLLNCNISLSNNRILCLCEASPVVDKYYFHVNGQTKVRDFMYVDEVVGSGEISCSASNCVGTGKSNTIYLDEETNGLLIGVIGAIILLAMSIIALILLRRHRNFSKKDDFQDTVGK